jgi:hypothetical protein
MSNRWLPPTLSLLALLACDGLAAQTMYKCKGPDGSQIFSHQPCPADAEHLNAGRGNSNDALKRTQALAAIAQRKDECIRHAKALAFNEADLRNRQHSDRISYIEGRVGSPGIAGTDRAIEMREEIADLRQAIVTEREQADAEFAKERSRCEDAERHASDALAGAG